MCIYANSCPERVGEPGPEKVAQPGKTKEMQLAPSRDGRESAETGSAGYPPEAGLKGLPSRSGEQYRQPKDRRRYTGRVEHSPAATPQSFTCRCSWSPSPPRSSGRPFATSTAASQIRHGRKHPAQAARDICIRRININPDIPCGQVNVLY